jgi:peptidoglycan/LPS O-acetylase OafA/YrhL
VSTIKFRFESLDMLRGMAAIFVLIEHTRAYVFVAKGALEGPTGILTKLFYAGTSVGHQAVIVFFALSGFLVGGQAIERMVAKKWSWKSYMIRRLTRLWIVLLPAILVTLFLDELGSLLTGGIGYDGSFGGIYPSWPNDSRPLDHSLPTVLGNIFFLQTILTPVLGSNGPLWSLANEFWYYLIFPLLAAIFLVPMRPILVACACILLGILLIALPFELLRGGLIWALGAAAAFVTRRTGNHRVWKNWFVRCGIAAFVLISIALAEISWAGIGDLLLGFAVVLALPVLAGMESPGAIYTRVGRSLSEISFTLYVTHFPLLTFLVMVGLAPIRRSPDAGSFLIFGILVAAAILFSVVLWQCFERHTDRVFEILISKLSSNLRISKPINE